MSDFRFYEKTSYFCPRCTKLLSWVKRTDVADSFVLIHLHTGCENSRKAFYPPAVTMSEIEGKITPAGFTPEFAR